MVSKNRDLLLDVGPEANGNIPPVQLTRLQALGAWLQQNGEAIYGTHPWERATGETSEGLHLRFTQKDSAVYATILGQPKSATITIKSFTPKPGTQIFLLGEPKPLVRSQESEAVHPASATIQPSISTISCKTYNNLSSKACYSLPRLLSPILARLP